MSKFTGRLILSPNEDETLWTVEEAFSFDSAVLNTTIMVPKGFVTDGASVPRAFWNIIPPFGKYGQAAILHDYLYRWQAFTREQSDDVLLEGMLASGCSQFQYLTIYMAVHTFGGAAWEEDKKKPLPPDYFPPPDKEAA
jgi:hypothetical protein